MALRPDLVARHLDTQVEQAVRNIEFLVPFGFRLFFGGGDFASNEGPMYSPKAFRELVLPRLKRVSDACHQHDAVHLFASDGDLWPVADHLFGQSGVDGYYEIDRRAGMGLGELRDRFPHLTLLGTISSHTLHLGSKAEVVAQTLSCLEDAVRHKGIIVGVSNYIVPHTPIDNVVAMLEAIRDHR
jgi:uroporphyrinogen-III decarboxylase